MEICPLLELLTVRRSASVDPSPDTYIYSQIAIREQIFSVKYQSYLWIETCY